MTGSDETTDGRRAVPEGEESSTEEAASSQDYAREHFAATIEEGKKLKPVRYGISEMDR